MTKIDKILPGVNIIKVMDGGLKYAIKETDPGLIYHQKALECSAGQKLTMSLHCMATA